MPNRIVREGILTSPRVEAIAGDPSIEVFYRRLHSVVDDYGRFAGDARLIRAACYPMRLDSVSEERIRECLAICEKAGLLLLYESDGKPFLELMDFNQKLRIKRSRYPSPPEGSDAGRLTDARSTSDGQTRADCPSESESESEVETESESSLEHGRAGSVSQSSNQLHEFLAAYPKGTKRDAAARAYLSVIDSPGKHASLMAGLRRWLESDQWKRSLEADGGRYVPDPDRFIFERLYLDEPVPHSETHTDRRDGGAVSRAMRIFEETNAE